MITGQRLIVRYLLRSGVVVLTVAGLFWLNSTSDGRISEKEHVFKSWCQEWMAKLDTEVLRRQETEADRGSQLKNLETAALKIEVATDLAQAASDRIEDINLAVNFVRFVDGQHQEEQLKFYIGNFESGNNAIDKSKTEDFERGVLLTGEQGIRILGLLEQSTAFNERQQLVGQDHVKITVGDREKSFSTALAQGDLQRSLPILNALTLLRVYAQNYK